MPRSWCGSNSSSKSWKYYSKTVSLQRGVGCRGSQLLATVSDGCVCDQCSLRALCHLATREAGCGEAFMMLRAPLQGGRPEAASNLGEVFGWPMKHHAGSREFQLGKLRKLHGASADNILHVYLDYACLTDCVVVISVRQMTSSTGTRGGCLGADLVGQLTSGCSATICNMICGEFGAPQWRRRRRGAVKVLGLVYVTLVTLVTNLLTKVTVGPSRGCVLALCRSAG